MSDDAAQTVYHATCALELATDILVDLYTFFSPPAPFQPFFVCGFSRTLAASAKLCDFWKNLLEIDLSFIAKLAALAIYLAYPTFSV